MNQVIGVFDSYSYRPMVWDVYVQQVELPKYGESPDQNVIAAALQQTETVLTELESWLGESDFLAGNALSLADLHGLPMLDCFGRAPDGKTLLGGYPLITQWLDRMTARKSAKSIL
jgi:glutathione S-transferase